MVTQKGSERQMSAKDEIIEIMAKALNHDRAGWSDKDWHKQCPMHKEDLRGHATACLEALVNEGYEIVKIDRKDFYANDDTVYWRGRVKINSDGTKSMGMNVAVLHIADHLKDPCKIAGKIAEIFNERSPFK